MGRPRTRDDGRILEAAEELLLEQRFADTSLRRLIERAEISPTAFYARFSSTEDVGAELVERLLSEMYVMAVEVTEHAPSVDAAIEESVRSLVRIFSARRVVVRFALTEGARIPRIRDAVHAALARLAALLTARIEELGARRDAEVDAEVLAWSIVGAMKMQVERWAVFEEFGARKLTELLLRVAHSLL